MDLTLFLAFLQAVLGVVSNPALSQSKKDKVLSYLGVVGQLAQAKADINSALADLTTRINSGELTDADFEALKSRSDEAHRRIQED